MMKRVKLVLWKTAALAVLIFSGCATKSAWITDYDEAQTQAQKSDKKIFLLFTADNPDDDAALDVRKNVFDSPALQKALKKNYVAVNIDFAEARYSAAEPPEDAGEAQTEAAGEAGRLLERDSRVAEKYAVEAVPVIYLLSKDGFVLGTIAVAPEIKTPAELIAEIDAQAEATDSIADLAALADTAEGMDKVRAIGELFDATDQRYRSLLLSHMKTALSLDEDNTTGIIGKFVFITAYFDAADTLQTGGVEEALEILKAAAAHPALAPGEKQEAFYVIASFMARANMGGKEEILEYLRLSVAADPDSESAPGIQQVIGQISAMPEEGPES
jgi:thioredoxin-related protein